jgi:hypothetical protein
MTLEIENLLQRVERLEQQNRRLKLIGLGIALCAGILLLTGAAKTPRTVEAEKIVLLDRQGRTRVTISTPEFTGAAIDTKPDDPVIWLTDDKGTDRAMLTADGLFFASSKAKPTLDLTSNPRPALKFYGPDGKVSWSAP